METFLKSAPLLFFIGAMVFILFRMNRSMRVQREAVDRQKESMAKIDESLALSREGITIAKTGAEMQRQMLEELRQIRMLLATDK